MIPIKLFHSIHFPLSILKQNPYKNEATKSMDNPVVNFKDVSGIAIVSQDGVYTVKFSHHQALSHQFFGDTLKENS